MFLFIPRCAGKHLLCYCFSPQSYSLSCSCILTPMLWDQTSSLPLCVGKPLSTIPNILVHQQTFWSCLSNKQQKHFLRDTQPWGKALSKQKSRKAVHQAARPSPMVASLCFWERDQQAPTLCHVVSQLLRGFSDISLFHCYLPNLTVFSIVFCRPLGVHMLLPKGPPKEDKACCLGTCLL